MRVRKVVRVASIVGSRVGFSRPEYYGLGELGFIREGEWKGRGREGLGGAYAGGDLLPPLIVQFGVGLAEDVVPLVFDAHGFKVPLGPCVARLGVDVEPDVGAGGDERGWADARDGAC